VEMSVFYITTRERNTVILHENSVVPIRYTVQDDDCSNLVFLQLEHLLGDAGYHISVPLMPGENERREGSHIPRIDTVSQAYFALHETLHKFQNF
jgi:hypothetical protein